MSIDPINTYADYRAARTEISHLMDVDPEINAPEGDRLDILVTLVQAYEAKHFPLSA